jgi:hypothetical protein
MVNLMFSKMVTERIVELWGLGFSAEETRKAFKDERVTICLNTIYKHRRSLTAQHLIDQLINKQLRDILSQRKDSPELSMRYRNELLKILIPQRIESYAYSKEEKSVKVDVEGLLAQYEDLFEEATILENAAPEPIHPPQANRKTGPVPPT